MPSEMYPSGNTFCSIACRGRWRSATRDRAYRVEFSLFARWTHDLAYWLGLLSADGCVSDDGRVQFANLDRDNTAAIRDLIAPETPIAVRRNSYGSTVFHWSLYSVRLVEMLARFGIVPRKSLTMRLPEIPAEYVWSFLRGLLDGDGSVDQAHRAEFATGSEEFALDLVARLAGFGLRGKIYRRGEHGWRVLLDVPSSTQLGRLMYSAPGPALERKRLRFRDWRTARRYADRILAQDLAARGLAAPE